MVEITIPDDTEKADAERSSEDIRQDIVQGEGDISRTVGQISDLIEEKLDWREYVKNSPFLATGAAAGLGYLASRIFIERATPVERIMGSIGREVRSSLGGVLGGAVGPGLILMTLQRIATKAAASWIKKSILATAAVGGDGPKASTARVSTTGQKADKEKNE